MSKKNNNNYDVNISGGDDSKKEIKEFSEDEIARIREKDPNAVIMKVAYDKVDRVMSMKEVKEALELIRGHYERIRKEQAELSDDEVRSRIRDIMPVADQMASLTHPKLFQEMTKRDATDDDFKMIMFNINLRSQVENNTMTEEEAMAALYAELFRQSKEKEEK